MAKKDYKNELKNWAIAFILIGISNILLSKSFSQLFDPAGGAILIILGIFVIFFRKIQTFVVLGAWLISLSLINIIITDLGFFKIIGFFQLFLGIFEIIQFFRYKNQQKSEVKRVSYWIITGLIVTILILFSVFFIYSSYKFRVNTSDFTVRVTLKICEDNLKLYSLDYLYSEGGYDPSIDYFLNCYLDVARSQQDTLACKMLKRPEDKTYCLEHIGIAQSDGERVSK